MTAGCEQGKSAEAEWTSELKERKRAAQIVQFGNCTRYHAELLRRIETIQLANYKSDAGFSSLLPHDREFCLKQALTWVAPRESPLVPTDGGDF